MRSMSFRSLFDLYRLRRNLRSKHLDLEKAQRRDLRSIVQYAYENVAFYHRKLDSANVKPNDIKSQEDMRKIPIITKPELQKTRIDDLVARNVNMQNCTSQKTSGSTGLPLTLLFDQRTIAFERALWLRAYFEDGLKIRDKMAQIMDPSFFQKRRYWYQSLGFLRRYYLSISDPPEKQIASLQKIRPDVIQSYPSSLAILAEEYRHDCAYDIQPRLLFTLSELLDRRTRELVNLTFKTELFDFYGCVELGPIAWECKGRIGYHVNSDSLLLETVVDGEPIVSGKRGDIVCTSLIRREMPLIRYKIGDIGEMSDEQCTCGVSLPLLKIVEGREDDFLISQDGRLIPPTVFFPYPFENFSGIKQFRVIQESREKLTIQLVAEKDFGQNPQIFEKATKEIRRLFGENMIVDFQILESIPRDPSKKLRKIISRAR